MLNRYPFFSCARTLSQSLMRLVMARSAARVACCQLLSSCLANVISISRAHGPWLSPSSSICRSGSRQSTGPRPPMLPEAEQPLEHFGNFILTAEKKSEATSTTQP
jgi:hypothetical protein